MSGAFSIDGVRPGNWGPPTRGVGTLLVSTSQRAVPECIGSHFLSCALPNQAMPECVLTLSEPLF
jgi:hypothetical protein